MFAFKIFCSDINCSFNFILGNFVYLFYKAMCGKYQCLGFFFFIPKCEQPNLLTTKVCSKLPNIILQFFEKSWIVTLFSQVNVVNYFSCRLNVKPSNKFISLF